MNLRLDVLAGSALLGAVDVRDIKALLKQLSPLVPHVSASDIFKVIAGGCLAVMRDLDSPRDDGYALVGMATLLKKRQLMGFSGLIEDVVVDEAYRGKGIAEALNLRLIEEAKRLGMKHLDLTSNPEREAANRLYQKLGYERRETNVYRKKLD